VHAVFCQAQLDMAAIFRVARRPPSPTTFGFIACAETEGYRAHPLDDHGSPTIHRSRVTSMQATTVEYIPMAVPVPNGVGDIILRCLEKDPALR
jgi:hypothetical protein